MKRPRPRKAAVLSQTARAIAAMEIPVLDALHALRGPHRPRVLARRRADARRWPRCVQVCSSRPHRRRRTPHWRGGIESRVGRSRTREEVRRLRCARPKEGPTNPRLVAPAAGARAAYTRRQRLASGVRAHYKCMRCFTTSLRRNVLYERTVRRRSSGRERAISRRGRGLFGVLYGLT